MQRLQHAVVFTVALFLGACALVNPEPAVMPTNVPDGIASHTFVYKHAFEIDRARRPDDVATYTGQWQNSQPKGQGRLVTSRANYACEGKFGIAPPPDFSAYTYYSWAQGKVFIGKDLVYQGYFINSFADGDGCVPRGPGTYFIDGWQLSGTFVNVREMKKGACTIVRSDGSRYTGTCSSPANANAASFDINSGDDLFKLIASPGEFTDANGRNLSADQFAQKLYCMKQSSARLAKLQRAYNNAYNACQRNTYPGNSFCFGGDEDHDIGIRLSDALFNAKTDLEDGQDAERSRCDNLDAAYQANLAADEKRQNEIKANDRREQSRLRDQQDIERAANTVTYNTPSTSPFQGLDSINKAMQPAQRAQINTPANASNNNTASGAASKGKATGAASSLHLTTAPKNIAPPQAAATPAPTPPQYEDPMELRWKRILAAPKTTVTRGEPLGRGHSEAEARADALRNWTGFRQSIEDEHARHIVYGRILSVEAPICYTMPSTPNDWFCKIPFTKEVVKDETDPTATTSK